jgi:hypothetical protein
MTTKKRVSYSCTGKFLVVDDSPTRYAILVLSIFCLMVPFIHHHEILHWVVNFYILVPSPIAFLLIAATLSVGYAALGCGEEALGCYPSQSEIAAMVQVVFRRSDDRSFWKRHVVLKWFCFVLLASIVFIKKFAGQQDLQDYEYSLLRSSATFSLASNADNARAMQEWRETFRSSCQQVIVGAGGKFNKTALDKKEAIEKEAVSSLKQSSHIRGTAPPAGHNPYKYCKNTFIDLGTNIGDSIGHFVNNAIDVCTPMWLEANPKHKINPKFPHPWLDVTELKIHHKGQVNNPFCGLLQHHMSSLGENGNAVLPENTCVYGMEGNPEFTDRLQRLENYIMGMNPRPLQYLHIHTESVVTAVDGPTKLYLDKTSVEHNVSCAHRRKTLSLQHSLTQPSSTFSTGVQAF